MSGRDPHQPHRAATPLELFFDLTFVVAYGIAGNEFAHLAAEGHFGAAIAAFSVAMFGICWAWINCSWFASAYDSDDWLYRLLMMVQMVGVCILAVGIPDMFKSVDAGGLYDGRVMVMGYVVMRVAMVALWLRAAAHDPGRRGAAMTYAVTLLIAQVIWVVLAFLAKLPVPAFFAAMVVPFLIELAGPVLAERKSGTPWHPHHIAERYGLFTIIALGEGIIGTIASVSAGVKEAGWNLDAILLCTAGIGLTFSMWWIYFAVPAGDFLHRHRERSFFWGYSHMLLFSSVAAMGAGLHVAGYYIEHKAHISTSATLLTVALPLALYIACVFIIYARLAGVFDASHKWQIIVAAVPWAASVALSMSGVPLVYCLLVLMLSPIAIVIAYEWVGHQHIAEHLEQ